MLAISAWLSSATLGTAEVSQADTANMPQRGDKKAGKQYGQQHMPTLIVATHARVGVMAAKVGRYTWVERPEVRKMSAPLQKDRQHQQALSHRGTSH